MNGGQKIWDIPKEHQWTKGPLENNTMYLAVTNWCSYSKAAKEPFLQFLKKHPEIKGYFIDIDHYKFTEVEGVPTVIVVRNSKVYKVKLEGSLEHQLNVGLKHLQS